VKMKRAEAAALISAGVNIFLFSLKFLLALFSGSIALLADSYHSGSDIFVSVLVFMGIKVSKARKIPSPRRRKIENLITLTISLFIYFIAFWVIKEVIGKKRPELQMLPLAMAGILGSIVISYFLSRYKIYVGRSTRSPSLVADGYHSLSDVYSSVAVLVGLAGYMIGLTLDRVTAIIVVFFIGKLATGVFSNAIRGLLRGEGLRSFSPSLTAKFPFLEKILIKMSIQRRIILRLGALLFGIGYVLSGFYTVGPGERAIVQRWGRVMKKDILPGLHYKLPFPLEKQSKVNIKSIRRTEIGFRLKKEVRIPEAMYVWERGQAKILEKKERCLLLPK